MKNLNYWEGDFASHMATLMILSHIGRKRRNSLPEEERQRIETEYREMERLQNIKLHLNAGRCPECKAKLTRGKKDKRNNYERVWHCSGCGKDFNKQGVTTGVGEK